MMTTTSNHLSTAGLAVELASIAGLLQEIERRWPIQAKGWSANREMVISWARAVTETGSNTERLRRGLAALASKPYPPSIGALIAAGSPRAAIDIEESFRRAQRALSSDPPAWHKLTPVEYAAVKAFGSYDLRHASLAALPRWEKIIDRLADQPDLPDPPPPPKAALEVQCLPPDVVHAKIAALRAEFGLYKPTKPNHRSSKS